MKQMLSTLMLFSILVGFLGAISGCKAKESIAEPLTVEELRMDNLCITVLYDNVAYFEELEADWGFACLIEGPEKTILFDTGAKGDILTSNYDGMALDPGRVNVIVVSHSHWDHVGGLEAFLARNSDVGVYVLTSFPKGVKKSVSEAGAELVEVSGSQVICNGVYTTGTMGKGIKEQALIITTDKGAIVITGCAHPGIVGIVRKAKEATGQEILAVVGGFHLGGASDEKIGKIIDELKEMGVGYVGPCHCTGEKQIELFRQAYGHRCLNMGVGREITGIDIIN